MADINLKTLTPGTAAASSVIVGATSTGAASPSLFTTTGSGNVALATSPTFVTPTLGVASATSINKVALTAPATGSTLTIAEGKTLTASNTLTLAGTDSTTMTFPSASGTVATLNAANLFTKANTFQPDSDAQAGTFRRNSSGQTSYVLEIQTEANATLAYVDKLGGVGGNSLTISGNISSAAWTTNGIRYKNVAATLTDTSSSGTVAAAYTNVFGGNTIAATNSTTFTDYFTTYISEPTAGTNVTFTNKWALGLTGNMRVTGSATVTGNVTAPNTNAATAALAASLGAF